MTSMYFVQGKLLKAFTEDRTDPSSGEMQRKPRIQVLGAIPTRDGKDTKPDLQEISVPDVRPYNDLVGKEVRVPIGMFSPQKGTVVLFVPKGMQPEAA